MDCGQQGLEFGSNEKIIYAYFKDSGALRLTRFDDSISPPLIEWTYGFPGHATDPLVGHKNLSFTKDMIIIIGRYNPGNHLVFGILIIPKTAQHIPSDRNIYYSPDLDSFNINAIYLSS